MTLGERIKQQREAKGITQLELARKIGYNTTGAGSFFCKQMADPKARLYKGKRGKNEENR